MSALQVGGAGLPTAQGQLRAHTGLPRRSDERGDHKGFQPRNGWLVTTCSPAGPAPTASCLPRRKETLYPRSLRNCSKNLSKHIVKSELTLR